MKLIGSELHDLLARANITPQTYKAMKARLGLNPTCNCEMWIDILNRTHAVWQLGGWRAAKTEYNRARDYYSRPR